MEIKIKKLHKDAIIPKYQTAGAACFDLHVCDPGKHPLLMKNPGAIASTLDTGLAFEIPEGYVMMVYSRSGHGFKNGVRLANCVGVVDSDYRGEVSIRLASDTATALSIRHGDRIAQAMIIPVNQVSFEEVEELGSTERGTSGFGSTGV